MIPDFRFSIDNTGAGPALIKRVAVTVDGKPVANWRAVITALTGKPGLQTLHSYLNARAVKAGDHIDVLWFREPGQPIEESQLARVGFEVCYCSLLDECWWLRDDGGKEPKTDPIATCPSGPRPFDD